MPDKKKSSEKNKKIRCAVVGASGYAGLEVIRILTGHPGAEVVFATSDTYKGKSVSEVFPFVRLPEKLKFEPHEHAASFKDADVFILSLPHGKSYGIIDSLLKKGKVVDISADFRLKNAADYEKWYGYKHPSPELLKKAVYGLTEIYRKDVRKARLLANPGCYPTSVGLAVHPLSTISGAIRGPVIIDSKSGYSGAGRSMKPHLLYSEGFGEFVPYAVTGHRHTSEMVQETCQALGRKIPVTFTPHLIPVSRGILSLIYVPLKEKIAEDDIRKIYSDFYRGEKFVRVMAAGRIPSIKQVAGTNLCLINVFVDTDTNMLKIVSSIDNLVKGAAGQAVQNMNLMFGIPEETGLDAAPLVP